MLLLISDASVLIDIEDGNLTRAMFSLPFQFAVPDILFHEELEKNHGHLLQHGLICKTLTSTVINDAYKLIQIYSKPSRNDLFALSLAKYENCQLLTGDKALYKIAKNYSIEVHGTIWLVIQMIQYKKITVQGALTAFEKMRNCGSRLPWDLIETEISKIEMNV